MQLRRSFLYWAKGNKSRVEALAFLVMLKKLSFQSTINHFSVNRISTITGCSWATCKKYIGILSKMDLVTFDSDSNILSIKRISSGTKHRNLCIDGIDFRNLRIAKDSIRHLIHMLALSAKHSVKEAIQKVNNPKTWLSDGYIDNRKGALKFCKKFVEQNAETGQYQYCEMGISYKTIAKEMGCCPMTAFRIIKEGIRNKLFVKHHNYESRKLSYAELFMHECYGSNLGYTFISKKGYGYKVKANSYELVKATRDPLFANFKKHNFQKVMTEDQYYDLVQQKDEKEKKFKALYQSKVYELSELIDESIEWVYSQRFSFKDLCKWVRSLRNEVVASGRLTTASSECYALVQY
jgi:hypothetical protein